MRAATDRPERLSREQFVSQGNAICAEGTRRLGAVTEEAFAGFSEENPPTEADLVKFAREKAIPELERQFEELDELVPPEDLEAELNFALEEARAAANRIKADPMRFLNDDNSGFERAKQLIAEAGLDVCAEE